MEIKFEWLMFKTRMLLKYYDWQEARMRKKYCHKGFHKITMGHHGFDINGKTRHFDYLCCKYCLYKFFASKRCKTEFTKWSSVFDKRAKEGFSDFLKSLSRAKSKTIKASVETKKGTSASVKKSNKRRG